MKTIKQVMDEIGNWAAFQAWEQVDAEVAMTISNQVWHRVMHQVEWHVLEEVNENH